MVRRQRRLAANLRVDGVQRTGAPLTCPPRPPVRCQLERSNKVSLVAPSSRLESSGKKRGWIGAGSGASQRRTICHSKVHRAAQT